MTLGWLGSLIVALFGIMTVQTLDGGPGLGLAIFWMALAISPLVTIVLHRLGRPTLRIARLAVGLAPVVLMVLFMRAQNEGPPPRAVAATDHPDQQSALYPAFAKKMLAGRLKDPDSARITDLMAFRTGGKLTLCGKVNAKNGFGGYGGPEPFIVSDDGVYIGEAEATADRVFAECKGTTTSTVSD